MKITIEMHGETHTYSDEFDSRGLVFVLQKVFGLLVVAGFSKEGIRGQIEMLAVEETDFDNWEIA